MNVTVGLYSHLVRFRLYPTPAQETGLLEHCAHARFVWNLALEQRNLYRPGRRMPSYAAQSKQLTEARANTWLGEGSRTVQEQALRDFDRALQAWYRRTSGWPTWRKQGRHEGFCISGHGQTFRVSRLNRRWGSVTVPQLGGVRFRWTRHPPETHTYRIKRDPAGRWWVVFAAKPPPIEAPGNGAIVGLDRGVTISVATSDGANYRAPRSMPAQARRRLNTERALARCKRGSNRRRAAKRRRAQVMAREQARRQDWIEKLSTDLARNYDVIRVEDLRIPNMVRAKRGLSREILASGWGELVRRLEDKAPGRVEKVDSRYTSQRCSACGHIAKENRKSQAAFLCVACGYTENADLNAAKNIAARHAVTARGDSRVLGSMKREPQRDSPLESVA